MLKHVMVAVFVAALGGSLFAQGSLSFTSTTAAGNGQSGIMFNITATSAITVYRVGAMTFSGAFTAQTDVWYRAGGYTTTSAGWVLAGSTSVAFPASGIEQIPINLNLSMTASQVYGICIVCSSGTLAYTTNTASSPDYVGTHMTIGSQGYGCTYSATSTPSGVASFFPRGYNGTVWYDLANSAILNVANLTGANSSVYGDATGTGGIGMQGASFNITNSSSTFSGTLTSVSVAASGSGADNTAYTQVALYRESNSTTSYDAGDTLIATAAAFPSDNGILVFNIPSGAEQAFATSQSKAYYIVVKFNGSPLPTPGHTFMYNISALGVGSGTVVGSLPTSAVQGFTILAPSFAFTDNALTQSSAFPSTGGHVLQDFSVSYPTGPANTLATVSLQATGSGNDATGYTSVAIYFDTDSSATFTAGDALAGTMSNFGADEGTAAVTLTANNSFTAGNSRRYFVVAAFSGSPAGGETFQCRISGCTGGYGGTTASGVPAPAGYTAGLVIATVSFTFTDVSPATQGTAFVGGTDFVLQAFTVTYSTGPTNTLTGITATAVGSGNDLDDYASVALWRDANSSGAFESAQDAQVDTQASFNSDNGTVTFTLSGAESQWTSSQSKRFFIVVAYNLNGANNTTFQSQITAASGLGMGAGALGVPAPGAGPAAGLLLMANNLVVTLNGPLAASAINANDQGVGGGGLMLGDFTVGTVNAAWTVASLTFTASGSGNDSLAYSYLALHEDTNGNGTFDGTGIDSLAVPVAGIAFGGDNGTYTANLVNQAFGAQSSRRFFVVVRMSGVAATGHTFNVALTAAAGTPPAGGQTSGVPSAATTSFIVAAPSLTVALGPASPNSQLREAGAAFGYTLAQFRLTAANASIGVNGLSLTSGGSGDFVNHLDATSGVELYADNGNGSFDAGLDTLLYSAAGVTGLNVCNFGSTLTVNNSTSVDIWVRLNVAPSAGGSTPETFRLVVLNTSHVSVVGGVTVLFGTPAPDSNTLGVVVFDIASFTPNNGPQTGGTAITITGSGFTLPFTCTINGVLCTGTPSITGGGTQVTGLVSPAGSGSNLPIVVTSGSLPPRTLTQRWSYFGGSSVGGGGGGGKGGGGGCSAEGSASWILLAPALAALWAFARRRKRAA